MRYDEYLRDVCYPDRPAIVFECLPEIVDEPDRQAPVVDISFGGAHFVIVPFCIEADFTIEVALFDSDGQLRRRRLISIMSDTNPFVIGGDP